MDPHLSTFVFFPLTVSFISGAESMHADTKHYMIKAGRSLSSNFSFQWEPQKTIVVPKKSVLVTAMLLP